MKVRVTFDFDREDRVCVSSFFGEDGPADYATMKSFIERAVGGELESLGAGLEARERFEKEGRDPDSPLETVR